MAIRIYGIRLSGGTTHQHIERLWWVESASNSDNDTRAQIVDWIENHNVSAYVDEGGRRVPVYVRTPISGPKYLQTAADGVWQNNLLALPHM